jgi:hypothetical protein
VSPPASPPGSVPTAPDARASWHYVMRPHGGFVYSATLALQAPEHAVAADAAPCDVNSETDAQIQGTLTLVNETPDFTGRPGVTFELGGGLEYASSDGCQSSSDGTAPGGSFYATRPIASGDSISEKIVFIVPNVYTPDNPDGGPSAYKNVSFQIVYYGGPGSNPVDDDHVPTRMSGPSLSDDYGFVDIAPVATR